MGNGCTSGHAVCGIPRFSVRSIVATLTFMGTAIGIATLRGYEPFLDGRMSFGTEFPKVWRIVAIVLFSLAMLYFSYNIYQTTS